ncbi:unnamed protein product [marine sediment metagenome]|uniref:Response regulatory domain-containing protein n=1 Tax=marine sediment metagenome TaxID=412755 RepID=X0VS96_9ZZZZ
MKKKIMIVDDEQSVILSVKTGLDDLEAGYEIIGVNSGEECLDVLKKGEIPNLILLDIKMDDGGDGIDVFNKLKEKQTWKNIPIVFLVDGEDKFDEFFINNVLGKPYIEKPFETTYLKRRIDNVLKEGVDCHHS